jgi:hypothetical protein
MTFINLLVQTPGLVLFDPVVLHTFLNHHHLPGPNVLASFQQDAALGQQALAQGVLLPVYSIAAWDYYLRVTLAAQPTVPAEWVLFNYPGFVLHVTSGRVLVSDIWALLNWHPTTYLQTERPPLPPAYASTQQFTPTQAVPVPNGRYRVTLVGFCERQNADLDTRPCGYEFLLVSDDQAVFDRVGSLATLPLDVVQLPAQQQ